MIFLLYKSEKSIIIKTEQMFAKIDNDKIEFIGKSEKNER